MSTLLDFHCGRRIHASRDPAVRRRFLLIALGGNVGLLAFFKYTDWCLDSLELLGSWLGADLDLHALKGRVLPDFLFLEGTARILVPVGISFYTFQTMSYTIDIYRGKLAPARNLLEFAFFVTFFPQLVAGPIVRAIDFLPQLELEPKLARSDLHAGLYRFGTGLAKKVLIADVLGRYLVDPVYAAPGDFSPLVHALCLYGFMIQIYYDFSGYSDCAIGTARMFGFRLLENFDGPYRSLSVREFWRRWHISLSSWVRDYIFFPLGGSRGLSELKVARNLTVTMVTIGIWHGASLLWVIYGLLNAGVMILERALDRLRGGRPFATTPLKRGVAWFLTFHFVVLSCIFIRAPDLSRVADMLADFGPQDELHPYGLWALAIGALAHFQPLELYRRFERSLVSLPTPVCGLLLGVVSGCVAILVVGETPFIYFQF
jgi:D-alanyl-lipoteichoic acid acyltransferase DltB (MBOAT superfamily)